MLTLLAAISGEEVVQAVIWIIVAGLVYWLLLYLIGVCGLPEPFNKVARIVLAVAAVLFLINLLLSFAGHPLVKW